MSAEGLAGVGFYVGIAPFGMASTALACLWLWRSLRGSAVDPLLAGVIVAGASMLILWGLWIVFDLGALGYGLVKLVARTGGAPRAAPQS